MACRALPESFEWTSPRLRIAARRTSGSFSDCAASRSLAESPARKNACRISRRTWEEVSVWYNCSSSLVIAADHVAAKNGVLHRSIVARGINLGERLARFSTTEDSQVFDRFTLQLGIALPARDSSENLAGLRRAALRHYKERF